MKASNTLTSWMKSQYGKVPQDFDQHYAALTKELSAHGPVNDVDMAAMINHRANMETQGRPVPMTNVPVKNAGMQAILAKMQAHGSQLPSKVMQMRQLPHLQDGGVIPMGQSAVVGDNQADPQSSTPETVTNTPQGAVVQPAPQAASIPAGLDPNQNGSASQLQAATDVAAKITGLSPQAVAKSFNPDQIMALYQKYQDTINSPARQFGNTITRFGSQTNGGAAGLNAANASIAADDARTKDSILGPALAGMKTLSDQQDIDRSNAPILRQGASDAINLPVTNSTNATTLSTNNLTQAGNAANLVVMKNNADPNSDVSANTRAIIKSKLGVTLPPTMSAAMIAQLPIKAYSDIANSQMEAKGKLLEGQAAATTAQTGEQKQNFNQGIVTGNIGPSGSTGTGWKPTYDLQRGEPSVSAGSTALTEAGSKQIQSSQEELKSNQVALQHIQMAEDAIKNAHTGPGSQLLTYVNGKEQLLSSVLGQLQVDKLVSNTKALGGVGELKSPTLDFKMMANAPDMKKFGSTNLELLNQLKYQYNASNVYNTSLLGHILDSNRGNGTTSGFTPPKLPAYQSSTTFTTEEDAQKANLAPGTRVTIGGQTGVWK